MILLWLQSLGWKVWRWVLLIMVALAAVVSIRRAGRNAERAENAERRVKMMKEANNVRKDIDDLSVDDVHKRLRDDWTRK